MRKVRVRVKPRFFVIMAILILAIVLPLRLCGGPATAAVVRGSISGDLQASAVIVRDETVQYSTTFGSVSYLADEGATVATGDSVASIYAMGYSTEMTGDLQAVRQQIVEYQAASVIGDLINHTLDDYQLRIDALVARVRAVAEGGSDESPTQLQRQLNELLEQRQVYVRSISPNSAVLNRLYDRENSLLGALAGWKTTIKATMDGYVSFYMDGAESWLTPGMLDMLTAAQVRAVFSGSVQSPYSNTTPQGRQALCRIISPENWYVVLVTSAKTWAVPVGGSCNVQFEGRDNQIFAATVRKISTEGSDVLVQLQMQSAVGPLLNLRATRVSVSSDAVGLLVPLSALHYKSDGSVGVYVAHGRQAEFVPVTLLSRDDRQASVAPVGAAALTEGMRVLLTGNGGA